MRRSLSLAIIASLFAALSAAAQSPDTTSRSPAVPSQNAAPPAEVKKPKKVWTNENLGDANGAVSVVGGDANGAGSVADDSKNGAKTKSDPWRLFHEQHDASFRRQLEKLQAQMTDADKQIADLKNFSKGEPSSSGGGIKLNKSYNREPIEAQIRALQEKKKDLQAKIDAVLDEARKRGVEPGQLR